MRKHGLILFGVTFVFGLLIVTANAQALDKEALKAEIKEEIKKELKGKAGIQDNITISGLIEAEAAFEDGSQEDSSDIVLATVEVGFDAKVNEWVSGHILFLYEEDDTEPMDVDEGTITMRNPEVCPGSVTAGKMYLPFGNFETNMVSDPLTLELGETNESAVLVGLEAADFHASVYAFNGDINEIGEDDEINGFGAGAVYAYENDGINIDIGVGYINNIGDSDLMTDKIPGSEIADYVAGYAAHCIFNIGPFTLIGEYVAAADDFKVGELPFAGHGAQPAAWNIELGCTFELAGKETTFALGCQGTEEALALELPKERYMVSVGVEVFKKTSLALELAYDEDYDVSDGGTGEDADIATIQLAVEF
ncbi:MAG: LbtU family siderophore porin [Desulfobacterales bacterium]|nr:LbtU family siderophore porin [Desulfobacterales bacterium]